MLLLVTASDASWTFWLLWASVWLRYACNDGSLYKATLLWACMAELQ